jgi:hypothetical protein
MDKLSDFVTRWFYSEHEPEIPEVFRSGNRFKERTMSHVSCNTGISPNDVRNLAGAINRMGATKRARKPTYHAYRSRLDAVREKFFCSAPPVDYALLNRYVFGRT